MHPVFFFYLTHFSGNIVGFRKRIALPFFEAIDFFLAGRYDGLIMITDEYADVPEVPPSFYWNILWMLYDLQAYQGSRLAKELEWITTFPKSKYTVLPPV